MTNNKMFYTLYSTFNLHNKSFFLILLFSYSIARMHIDDLDFDSIFVTQCHIYGDMHMPTLNNKKDNLKIQKVQ